MLEKHSGNGYAVISACRGDKSPEDNQKATQELISDIQQRGYSYTPMYGGFKENFGTEDETDVFERSIMVYNYDRKGNAGDMEDLFNFAVEMCNKYNQDSVLVKRPEGNPEYITKDGSVDMYFDKPTTFNDFQQEYFSDLHNGHKSHSIHDRDSNGGLRGAKSTRFTLNTSMFDECYINPSPATLNEAHSRRLRGEVFLPYKKSINEASINAKKRAEKDIKNVFNGKNMKNIKSIAVFTAENPDSTPASGSQNKKYNKSLSQIIKQAGYAMVPVMGKFGSVEHSFAVINMPVDLVKRLCGKFQQTSFIFSTNTGNGFHNEYWQKADETQPYDAQSNDYVLLDQEDSFIDASDFDDYYTRIGEKFQYSIPFSIFENVNKTIEMNGRRMIKEGLSKSIEDIFAFINRGNGQNQYNYRKALYRGLI